MNSRFRSFLLHLFVSCGIQWAFLRPDSCLTRGESFLTAIIVLCYLELSANIRRIGESKEDQE